MVDPTENLQGNVEETATVIEATSAGIPCTVTKMANKPVTPSETTLGIPISTIPGTLYLYSAPRHMNIYSPVTDISSPKYYFPGSSNIGSLGYYRSWSSNSVIHDKLPPKTMNIINIRNIPSVKKYVPGLKPSIVSVIKKIVLQTYHKRL